MENSREVPQKMKNSFHVIVQPHSGAHIQIKLYFEKIYIYTGNSLTIAKTWKQPRCPSRDEWIKMVWCTHTMAYHSAIKKKEVMSFAATWMDLDIISWVKEVRTKTANTHDWMPMPSKLNSGKRPERYLKINIVPNVSPDNTYSTQCLFGWLQLNFPRFLGQKMWSNSWVFFFSHFICNLNFKNPVSSPSEIYPGLPWWSSD